VPVGVRGPERDLAVGFTRTLLTRHPDLSTSHTLRVMNRLRETLEVA
jgi:hypothetical protein